MKPDTPHWMKDMVLLESVRQHFRDFALDGEELHMDAILERLFLREQSDDPYFPRPDCMGRRPREAVRELIVEDAA